MNLSIIDNIVHCYYNKQDMVDIEKAKMMVKERVAFCEGESRPHLFDISDLKKVSKEARDYFANEGNECVTASAIIVTSPVIKIIANFFIIVNKPKNPTQLFTKRKEAIKWLAQYKKRELAHVEGDKSL